MIRFVDNNNSFGVWPRVHVCGGALGIATLYGMLCAFREGL